MGLAKDGTHRGRRSKRDEALIHDCLNKTWRQFERWIADESIPINERVKASIPLLAKSMPQEVRKRTDHIVRYLSSLPRPNAIEPPTIDVTRCSDGSYEDDAGGLNGSHRSEKELC
jgi:hypothetical protein